MDLNPVPIRGRNCCDGVAGDVVPKRSAASFQDLCTRAPSRVSHSSRDVPRPVRVGQGFGSGNPEKQSWTSSLPSTTMTVFTPEEPDHGTVYDRIFYDY